MITSCKKVGRRSRKLLDGLHVRERCRGMPVEVLTAVIYDTVWSGCLTVDDSIYCVVETGLIGIPLFPHAGRHFHVIVCTLPAPLAATLRQSNGEVRRAACRQAAPARPSLTPRACDLRPLGPSMPDLTRLGQLVQNYLQSLRKTYLYSQPTMESERLFRFPKPQWLNSANTRTAGVYLAGGLVCDIALDSRHHLQHPLTRMTTVLRRPVHPHRCRQLLEVPPQRLHLPFHLRGLDSRHLLCSRHDRHQQHRQDSPVR